LIACTSEKTRTSEQILKRSDQFHARSFKIPRL
jgi:hypothetical protein